MDSSPPSSDRPLLLLRLVVLSALSFVLMLSYSVARPATESLFLETHTSAGLPLAWVLVAAVHVAVVSAYSRFVTRVDLVRLYGDSSALSALVLCGILALRAAGVPGVDYALYVWKDIYVVVLVEAFYTYTNTVFSIRQARWAYGLFGVISALGSVVGNLLVGHLAGLWGTASTLLLVPPLLVVIWGACLPFSRAAGARAGEELARRPAGLGAAVRVVRRSSYLFLVLMLICTVQVVITLVDLEYNAVLEATFSDMDERTAVIGYVYAAASVGTVALHALTGPILRLAGVPLVLLAVPVLLASGLAAYVIHPRMLTVALLKVASKVFDYTIFRSAKEILYIPLTVEAKTLGKSVVDLLTYRVAKGAISLALYAASFVALTTLADVPMPAAAVLVAAWLALTLVIARRFRSKVSRAEEMRAGGRDPSGEETIGSDRG